MVRHLILSDGEAIAIEITGEWLGFHGDKDIWKYFKHHWPHLFPKLPDRSQFARQTANLWLREFISNFIELQSHIAPLSAALRERVYRKALLCGLDVLYCCH